MIREIGWFRIVFIYTDKKSIQKKMMSTAGNALSFLFVPMGQITNTPKGVVRFFPTPHCNIYVFLYHSVRLFFGKHFNGLIIPFILLWDYRYLRPCACYLCRPKGAWSRVARAFQDRTSFVAKDKDLGQSQQRSVCRTKTMRTRSYRWGTKRTILYSYTNFNQVFAFFFFSSFTQQLDNKSSPLALLAQTCSAIGADTTNPKLLAANIEKSTKQLQHQPKGSSGSGGSGSFGLSQQASMDGSARDKSSPVSSHSSSVSTGSVEQQQLPPAHGSSSSSKPTPTTFKPYEPNNNISNITTAADCGATNLSSNNTSAQQRVKTPKSMTNGGGQRCDSNQSASSQHRESPTAAGSLRRTPTSGLAGGVMQHNGSPGLPPTASTTPGRSNSKESAAMHSPSAAAAAAAAAAQIASSNRLQEAALAAAKEANYVKALHAASQQGSASAAAAAASYYPPGKCHLKLWVVEIRRAQASEYFVRSLEMW